MTKTIIRLCLILIWGLSFNKAEAADPTFISTFESISIYWLPANPDTGSVKGCAVRYRRLGGSTDTLGQGLVWDSTAAQRGYRGSIVKLVAGSSYRIQLDVGIGGASFVDTVTMRTETDLLPIGVTVNPGAQSTTYAISTSGTLTAYRVYDFQGNTVDANGATNGITINASHIIVRNFKVQEAAATAILINGGADIIIEDSEITEWGPFEINCNCTAVAIRNGVSGIDSVIIQRNRFYNPNTSALSWTYGHPGGPLGINAPTPGHGWVIRYNSFYSTSIEDYVQDWVGSGPDFGTTGGFKDTDIYGNSFENWWDDAVEIDGRGQNVRVWENYFDAGYINISGAAISLGPSYIWRNISNTSRKLDDTLVVETSAQYNRGHFFKGGGDVADSLFTNGWVFFYHNTLLQEPPVLAGLDSLGVKHFIDQDGGDGGYKNHTSKNNNAHLNQVGTAQVMTDAPKNLATNSAGYDLTIGDYNCCGGGAAYNPANDIRATPRYNPANKLGEYALLNLGTALDGVADATPLAYMFQPYDNVAPDVGAFETGQPALEFGYLAYTATLSDPVVPTGIVLIKRNF